MIASLALVSTVGAALLALVTAAFGLVGRPIGRGITLGGLLLECALLAQAVRDGVGLAAGHRPADPATHIGYLACSAALLPVVTGVVRGDRARWGTFAIAIGFATTAVVIIRMQQTWYGADV